MKISDILEKLQAYPPNADLIIMGPVLEDPCMFYEDGTYVLREFETPDAKNEPGKPPGNSLH